MCSSFSTVRSGRNICCFTNAWPVRYLHSNSTDRCLWCVYACVSLVSSLTCVCPVSSPQGAFTWNSMSGRSVRLKPVPLQSLSELERVRLQEVAFSRLLQDDNLGCQISIPKGTLLFRLGGHLTSTISWSLHSVSKATWKTFLSQQVWMLHNRYWHQNWM